MMKQLYACLVSSLLFLTTATFAVADHGGGGGGGGSSPGGPGGIPGGGPGSGIGAPREPNEPNEPNEQNEPNEPNEPNEANEPNNRGNQNTVPMKNPNGTPPFGKATSAPDTDRGNSEGKGHNDIRNLGAMQTFTGTVTAFTGTALTLTLANGTTRTFTVNAHAHEQMRPKVGQTVFVKTNGTATVLELKPRSK